MFAKLRSEMIRLYNVDNNIVIRSVFGGKKVISKDLVRVLDDSLFVKKTFSKSVKNISKKKYTTKVSVQGFFSSGSTAVIDLLREFDNVTAIAALELETCNKNKIAVNGDEIKFFSRMELDRLEDIVYINDDMEIDRRIKRLIYNAKKELTPLYSSRIVYVDLEKEFNNFLLSIVDVNYHNIKDINSFFPIRSVCDSNFIKNNNDDYIFYKLKKNISSDDIVKAIKKFISNIFNSIYSNDILVLDQFLANCINGHDLDYHKRLLGDIKQIAVYRDPRDQFMTNFLWSEHIWHDTVDSLTVSQKVANYKLRLDLYKKFHPDRLFISFESLVKDYENSVDKICNFLGIDKSHHVNKFNHFNPEVSRKNIGIYKNFHDQKLMQQIYENFKEYCHEG